MKAILRYGDKGADVKVLQNYLHLTEDGQFGRLTLETLKAWQHSYGLVPDGVCGSATWQALERVYGVKDSEVKQGDAYTYDEKSGEYNLVKTSRYVNDIILHCTATREGQDWTVRQIKKMHTDPVSKGGRGWSDIAYHYVIYRDGSVRMGRPIGKIGGHCTNHNSGSIGIVYVGGVDSRMLAKDTRTTEQKVSLVRLVRQLLRMYKITKRQVHGHCEYANKGCPCFDMEAFRKEL